MSSSALQIPGRPGETFSSVAETPGGTLYGTTPGGTRIVYDRTSLMNMAHSPLSSTPPVNLPNIPGVTKNTTASQENEKEKTKPNEAEPAKSDPPTTDEMFEMDE